MKNLVDFNITLNEEELNKLITKLVHNHLDKLDAQVTYWDTKELKKQTNMSWNTIQENFFHDPRLPKRKIGGKWYYPAKQTREFLETWIMEKE